MTVRQFLITLLMCVSTSTLMFLWFQRQIKKVAVVDAVKMFNQFHLKEELESAAKKKLEYASKQADSIENKLQLAKATKNVEEAKQLLYALNYLNSNLEKQYQESNDAINKEVWNRLNPLIDEYAKKKGLHLLLGANGMGSVLYDDQYFDVTDEAITFINKNYETGN